MLTYISPCRTTHVIGTSGLFSNIENPTLREKKYFRNFFVRINTTIFLISIVLFYFIGCFNKKFCSMSHKHHVYVFSLSLLIKMNNHNKSTETTRQSFYFSKDNRLDGSSRQIRNKKKRKKKNGIFDDGFRFFLVFTIHNAYSCR